VRTPTTLLALAAALALAVAGCGSSSSKNAGSNAGGAASTPAASGGGQQLALAAPADGSLKFDKKTLTAKAGTVTVNFTNPSTTAHGLTIEGNGVDQTSDTITSGKTAVTAKLKPGTYTFYCPVGSHRAQGMEGKLVVK
jgi:plastocyanin